MPRRQTTISPLRVAPGDLPVPLTRDHLSVKDGTTLDGRMLFHTQTRSYRGPDVVRFLKHPLSPIPGKPLVLWDGSPIRRAQPVKEILAAEAGQGIHLERLPSYAPDLDPQEGIWDSLSCARLSQRMGSGGKPWRER